VAAIAAPSSTQSLYVLAEGSKAFGHGIAQGWKSLGGRIETDGREPRAVSTFDRCVYVISTESLEGYRQTFKDDREINVTMIDILHSVKRESYRMLRHEG